MFPILYKYLALHKILIIPGIGTFAVEETPAAVQFTEKQISAPASRIIYKQIVQPTNNHFYTFLSKELGVEKVIAIRRFKDEVEKTMDELKDAGSVSLPGLGLLRREKEGVVSFVAAASPITCFEPLPADRVIRKNAQHKVLVGEREHVKEYSVPQKVTSDIFGSGEGAGNKWWIYALILTVLAVVIIVIYYTTQ